MMERSIEEDDYYTFIRQLPCAICGHKQVEVHHLGKRSEYKKVVPLCGRYGNRCHEKVHREGERHNEQLLEQSRRIYEFYTDKDK